MSEKRKSIKGAILSRGQAPMVRKELDDFFAEFFAPKRQKSLVKQGFCHRFVKSSCNDVFRGQNDNFA